MKRASSILLLAIPLIFSICISPKLFSAETSDKVLIIIKERYGSADIQFLENDEVILMKQSLVEAGFKVEIASASGRTFWFKKVTLESDVKLAEANVEDYVGFIITCSALGINISLDRKQEPAFGEAFSKLEEVAIAKQIVEGEKPVAAQHKGVVILAKAGVLEGKKYSYQHELEIDNAIYGGLGVIKDGNIITSSFCPYYGSKDQTVKLTKALIAEIQK